MTLDRGFDEDKEENPYELARRLSRERRQSSSASVVMDSVVPNESFEDYLRRVEARDPSFIRPLPVPGRTEHHSAREMLGRKRRFRTR